MLDAHGILHDIASPLTVVQYVLHLLKDDAEVYRKYNELLRNAEISIDEAVEMISSTHRVAPLNLAVVLAQVNTMFAEQLHIQNDLETELWVAGTHNAAMRIFSNIAGNALDAGATRLHIEAELSEYETQLLFHDNGVGISAEVIGRIFDCGFSTKQNAHGGWGLYLVKTLMQDVFGGRVTVQSSSKGTTFKLHFPLQKQ